MSDDLRKRTEAELPAEPEQLDELSPEHVRQLVHELRTHQIELELQNEELRLAQQDLAAARDRYIDLYDFAPVGYLTVSTEGLIAEANLTAATMFGDERSRLIGRGLSTFIIKEDQDIYYRHRRELLQSGGRRSCELRLRRKNGDNDVFWARIECAPLAAEDVGAASARIRCAVIDVTTVRERAERELLAAQERLILAEKFGAIGRVSAGIAHEVKNPLATIRSSAEILGKLMERLSPDALPERDRWHTHLRRIESNVDRCKEIIDSLLGFSWRGAAAAPVDVDVVAAVKELIENMPANGAHSRSPVVATCDQIALCDVRERRLDRHWSELDGSSPVLTRFRPMQLAELLGNLLDNALQATAASGRVVIGCREVRDRVEITVADTGPGISSGNLPQIFEPFFTTRQPGQGTGLGLFLCRRIVEAHGGTIDCESEQGTGTLLRACLPR